MPRKHLSVLAIMLIQYYSKYMKYYRLMIVYSKLYTVCMNVEYFAHRNCLPKRLKQNRVESETLLEKPMLEEPEPRVEL